MSEACCARNKLSKTTCCRWYGLPSTPCVVLAFAMFCETTSMRIRSASSAAAVLLIPERMSIINQGSTALAGDRHAHLHQCAAHQLRFERVFHRVLAELQHLRFERHCVAVAAAG